MAFDILSTMNAIRGHLEASGHYTRVLGHEPKSPVSGNQLTAGVFMLSAEIAELVLDGTIEVHTVAIRLYQPERKSPVQARDDRLDRAVADLYEETFGEFDLGTTIRGIDVGGQYGTPPSSDFGYLDVGGTQHRVADFVMPLIVNGTDTLAA